MKRVLIRGQAGEFGNYVAALTACGMEPVLTMDLTLAQTCDGLLLPGGADVDPVHYGQENRGSVGIDPDRDQTELELIRLFRQMDRPILGICRGHQILNVALGGTLIQDLSAADYHRNRGGEDRIHPVRVVHPMIEALYGREFVSNSSHHQAVDRLAPGLVPTCYGEDGVLEGFVHENGRILGVQFHPERMAFALARPDAADGAAIFHLFRQNL